MLSPAVLLAWLIDGGGWKWLLGGAAALVVSIWAAVWLHNYHTMQEKAARTDKLEGQLSDFTGRLAVATKAKEQADKDRDLARATLAQAEKDRSAYFTMLRKGMADAAVKNNPICWPTDSERRMRNEAGDRFIPGFGSVGAGSGLPAVAR